MSYTVRVESAFRAVIVDEQGRDVYTTTVRRSELQALAQATVFADAAQWLLCGLSNGGFPAGAIHLPRIVSTASTEIAPPAIPEPT